MSPPDGLTVRGFLADDDTGAGLGGLRVELWSTNGAGPRLVAAGQSDDAGLFRLRLAPQRLADKRHPRSLDVELRVLDAGRQLVSEVRTLPLDGHPATLELRVPQFLSTSESTVDEQPIPDRCEVMGHVKGSPPEGATVRAVLSTLREGVYRAARCRGRRQQRRLVPHELRPPRPAGRALEHQSHRPAVRAQRRPDRGVHACPLAASANAGGPPSAARLAGPVGVCAPRTPSLRGARDRRRRPRRRRRVGHRGSLRVARRRFRAPAAVPAGACARKRHGPSRARCSTRWGAAAPGPPRRSDRRAACTSCAPPSRRPPPTASSTRELLEDLDCARRAARRTISSIVRPAPASRRGRRAWPRSSPPRMFPGHDRARPATLPGAHRATVSEFWESFGESAGGRGPRRRHGAGTSKSPSRLSEVLGPGSGAAARACTRCAARDAGGRRGSVALHASTTGASCVEALETPEADGRARWRDDDAEKPRRSARADRGARRGDPRHARGDLPERVPSPAPGRRRTS